MANRPITVTIAEDDVLVRAGIEGLLGLTEGIEVLDTCGSLDELLESVRHQQPHVVVTDIRMPPTFTDEGVVAATIIGQEYPDVGVIVLSQFVDPGLAAAVLAKGSRRRGYLLKEHVADREHLVTAIRSVARSGSFIDPEVLDHLVVARTEGAASLFDRLSKREIEVLSAMAQGMSNAAIAEQLFIGERGVEKHISNIFRKLELTGATDLHRRVAAVLEFLTQSSDRRDPPRASPDQPLRVGIVDDDAGYATVLQQVIDLSEGFDVVSVTMTVPDAIAAIPDASLDVALIDVNMPDGGGLAVIDAIAHLSERPVAVLLSAEDPPDPMPAETHYVAKADFDVETLAELLRTPRSRRPPA